MGTANAVCEVFECGFPVIHRETLTAHGYRRIPPTPRARDFRTLRLADNAKRFLVVSFRTHVNIGPCLSEAFRPAPSALEPESGQPLVCGPHDGPIAAVCWHVAALQALLPRLSAAAAARLPELAPHFSGDFARVVALAGADAVAVDGDAPPVLGAAPAFMPALHVRTLDPSTEGATGARVRTQADVAGFREGLRNIAARADFCTFTKADEAARDENHEETVHRSVDEARPHACRPMPACALRRHGNRTTAGDGAGGEGAAPALPSPAVNWSSAARPHAAAATAARVSQLSPNPRVVTRIPAGDVFLASDSPLLKELLARQWDHSSRGATGRGGGLGGVPDGGAPGVGAATVGRGAAAMDGAGRAPQRWRLHRFTLQGERLATARRPLPGHPATRGAVLAAARAAAPPGCSLGHLVTAVEFWLLSRARPLVGAAWFDLDVGSEGRPEVRPERKQRAARQRLHGVPTQMAKDADGARTVSDLAAAAGGGGGKGDGGQRHGLHGGGLRGVSTFAKAAALLGGHVSLSTYGLCRSTGSGAAPERGTREGSGQGCSSECAREATVFLP